MLIVNTFFIFSVVLLVNSVYIPSRYGKRIPLDISQVSAQQDGGRAAQRRSQEGFYLGTRYSGKRDNMESEALMPEISSPVFQTSTKENFPIEEKRKFHSFSRYGRGDESANGIAGLDLGRSNLMNIKLQGTTDSIFQCTYIVYVGFRCFPRHSVENAMFPIGESQDD